ncbi:MAG: ABC transporter permease [Solobacterium sp.]|nr:ABC transporter permease [Solobacterium sp.]
MNFFARGIRYIVRKPTKSLLLAITFFLIGNLVILGMGISQASDNAKTLTRKKMRAVVSYEVDYNSFWNYLDNIEDSDEYEEAVRQFPSIDRETAVRLSEDERVIAFNYMQTNIAYTTLDHVPLGNESEDRGYGSYIDENGEEHEYIEPNLMIYANFYPDMIELEEGTYTIVDGRWYSQNDIDTAAKVVCITQEFAEVNALSVGDTITISNNSPSEFEMDRSTYEAAGVTEDDFNLELEVIGIYSTPEDVDPSSENFRWMSPYESPKNRIQMPMSTQVEFNLQMVEIMSKAHPDWYEGADMDEIRESSYTPSKVIYLLDDPLNVDEFVADHTKELGEYLKLNANNDTFRKMARPLDTMSFFANIVVWIVVINAIVIISLVTALTLKTREYEIGVLLSIGVSKLKVIAQLFVELIIVAFIGFAGACLSGSLIAGKVGETVLEFQTASDAQYETEDNNYYVWSDSTDYFTTVTQEDLLSEYHVAVSPLLIGEIFLLGTGVVLIAIVIPSVMIMRLNPKQILLEQN